jgi:hypothetical protein
VLHIYFIGNYVSDLTHLSLFSHTHSPNATICSPTRTLSELRRITTKTIIALTIFSQPSLSAPPLLSLIPTQHFLLAQIGIADLLSLFSLSMGLSILCFPFSEEIIFNLNTYQLIIQIKSQIVSEKKIVRLQM